MQRSSPSIAALATALAKAQTELANPEKSLTGTIEPQDGEGSTRQLRPSRPPRSIRPLASSISQPCSRTPQANGSPRTGRFVRLLRPNDRTAWARR
jgi:hypothetical protein